MKQDGLKKNSQEEEKLYTELLSEIVAIRKKKGLTQKQLAEITGLIQANISRFENPSKGSTVLTMLKILNALGYKITIDLKDK